MEGGGGDGRWTGEVFILFRNQWNMHQSHYKMYHEFLHLSTDLCDFPDTDDIKLQRLPARWEQTRELNLL